MIEATEKGSFHVHVYLYMTIYTLIQHLRITYRPERLYLKRPTVNDLAFRTLISEIYVGVGYEHKQWFQQFFLKHAISYVMMTKKETCVIRNRCMLSLLYK